MSITLATFNIWFNEYHIYERVSHIITEILQSKPRISVIALQEVTPKIFEFINQSPLKSYYNFANPENHLTNHYDVIILIEKTYKINKYIKHPFNNTKMSRNIEIVSITNIKTKKQFLISTSHLESEFFNKSNKKINNTYDSNIIINENSNKIKQFQETFELLDKINNSDNLNKKFYDLIIFMGDMNITDIEEELFNKNLPNDWKDYFIEFGSPKYLEFTYDHTKNNNTYYNKKSRLDRIYYKKNEKTKLEPYSFTFLGQEPAKGKLFFSDHFGLVATFIE
jgi:exonuclease III